ncbi:type II toxin-antitoxin system PrlF family antitoxin [Rhodoferax sp.]|jgi:AbrB family looped-hinge helix DNA binding protein|uniref:AbrB/MazE/SpoVT family DNA-binding domain-containing protein n=1 Tax=Rhodoferax sp. TaxID=50421 RepID=UPI00260435D1|nr:type II toxin-antitoxin system PrlF family antitoxin [Rhodoferax sp.]MDD4945131.1 type II toxin-antitoxin system PrlF family antitoxin [Rhodoferax sp.]MDD5479987.1 type II toxin-antitoxin system PrlF family antitoxin [Rhodoferax sp.]
MSESTMTVKGQTTVPQPIREAMHIQPGSRLTWNLMPDGTAIVRAKTKSVLDLAGMLKAPPGITVSIESMNPWR